MSRIDLAQFHEVFFEESFEGLHTMEAGLLALDPSQPATETVNNVFRAAHSIKGGAATFGFQEVADFTHGMESLLDEVRSGGLPVTDDLIQRLLEAVDFLKFLLQESQAGRQVEANKIASHAARLGQDEAVTPASGEPPSKQSSSNWKISFVPREGIYRSGNDPYRVLRELSELGEVQARLDASKLPSLEEIDPESSYLSWELTLLSDSAGEDEIRELFEWIEDEADVEIEAGAPAVDEAPDEEEATVQGEPVVEALVSQTTPEVSSIRVNIDRVDLLVNLVGELVITQSMLSRFKDSNGKYDVNQLIKGIEQLEENTRELQEHIMRIRMLPIDNVFQRMPRLVRDLSKSLEKDVTLQLNGSATEVDKTVLEKISDPLTHLVRNCLDHGIEGPDERLVNGKPARGTVTISAYHEGGSIVIEVSDDGRGLNRDAILAKAIENGTIEPGTELSDFQIDHLIFSAGFSTAAEVSDVSGRGVGMDVVRNNIEQLNGHIDVQSVPGEGSTFTIRLPLTLAIIEGQLVRVGCDVFVIPILSIVKSTKIDASDYNHIGGDSHMFRIEEDYIPIVSLEDVYRIRADYQDDSEAILVVVDAKERYGVLVDEVLGQQQVVVKSLETNFKSVPTISGATILGDGTVAMILDMPGLLRQARGMEEPVAS